MKSIKWAALLEQERPSAVTTIDDSVMEKTQNHDEQG